MPSIATALDWTPLHVKSAWMIASGVVPLFHTQKLKNSKLK